MTSEILSSDVTFNVACELSQPGKTEVSTLSHRLEKTALDIFEGLF